uniref:Expansin n=1 Tax=Aegilops tauschii TaxID=37682 RepID=N1QX38_AEGTA
MAAGMRFLQLFAAVLAFSFVPAKSDYWHQAYATFYGGADGSETMGGACGYDNLYAAGYGLNNAALSTPAWENLAIYRAGIVPILSRRVACQRQGGLRFTISGFNFFELVLVTNIAMSGSIRSMSVKGTNTAWITMSQNWGANWQCLAGLKGQALSFAITSSGGQYKVFQDVVPAWWLFGQTFSTWQQFDY